MKLLELPKTDDKHVIFAVIESYLNELGIKIASTDFERPWGGFFVIEDESTERFIEEFFPGYSYDQVSNGLKLTPKILVAAPEKRLSWQWHERREEIWSVVHGPVGIITSPDNTQGLVRELNRGDVESMGTQMRHRLIGLKTYGVVAEFWKHTDPTNPSTEADIHREEDDFARAA